MKQELDRFNNLSKYTEVQIQAASKKCSTISSILSIRKNPSDFQNIYHET